MAEITRKQWLEKCAAQPTTHEDALQNKRMPRTEEEQLHDIARVLASELAPLYKQMETQIQRREHCTKEGQKETRDERTWAIHEAAARQFETDMQETGARIEGLIFRYLDPQRRPALDSAYDPQEAGK